MRAGITENQLTIYDAMASRWARKADRRKRYLRKHSHSRKHRK